jgi:hypothetical protein
VSRRCPTSLTLLVVGLTFGSSLRPTCVRADSIDSTSSNPFAQTAEYTLTSVSNLPAPTGPPPGTPVVTRTATLATGSPTVTLPSTSGLSAGYQVSGTGIPSGTTVTQVNPAQSQVTLSQSSSTSGSQSLVFTPNVAPPQIVAQIIPPGGVYTPPTTSTVGPLTVQSDSKGFTANQLYDSLATTTDANGKPEQLLGLSFYGQGLQAKSAGGLLHFTLAVTNPASPPELRSLTSGVTITLDPSSSGASSVPPASGPITNAQVPEPVSVLLWALMVGAGIVQVTSMRRSAMSSRQLTSAF